VTATRGEPCVSLLDLDPGLFELVAADRLPRARLDLKVRIHHLATGAWRTDRISSPAPEHLGLLIVDGVLARDIVMADTVSTELVGPGDFLRPWGLHEASDLVPHSVQWTVLAEGRVALLDQRFAIRLGNYPEVNAVLLDRLSHRVHRLALTQAIAGLNRVDRRLLSLFWHFAELWGRMTPEGILIPMTISHRLLGQLIGARRPTVSTALGRLKEDGELERRPNGTWLLTGEPMTLTRSELERVVPPRRHFLSLQPSERLRPPAPDEIETEASTARGP
jgi:CRP/FNR family cyclic AMP-dependent transcriptional regulator